MMVIINSGFAGTTNHINRKTTSNDKVTTAFYKDFATAKDIGWTKSDQYYVATFSLDGTIMYAWYDENGNSVGTFRNMISSELPLRVQTELRTKYGSMWISELFEFSTADNTGYFVTLENADQKITLKSDNGGKLEVYRKIEKL